MEALVLVGGFIFLFVSGFWLMDKIDHFLNSDNFSPYWDEEEEREAKRLDQQNTAAGDSTDSLVQK